MGSSDYISKSSSSNNTQIPSPNSKAQAIVKKFHEQLGKPYVWGAEGPNSFDCSGLVHYVYGQNGIKVPKSIRDQYKSGKLVNKSQLQPGDLNLSSTDGRSRSNACRYICWIWKNGTCTKL